ncbi:MAG: GHKL domain-containing protein [Erysipelotrichaceae bacterium]|nr:GHKL domain-containing protein [Erysipelotrichaceae bacterium]
MDLFDLIVNIYECALMVWFLCSLTSKHKKNYRTFSLFTLLVTFLLLTIANMFSPSQSLLLVLFVIVYCIYLKLTTFYSFPESLVFSLLLYVVIAVTNTVFDITFILLMGEKFTFLELLELYSIPTTTFLQVLHTVCFYFIAKSIRDKELGLSNIEYLIISALLLIGEIVAVCFETIYLGYENIKIYLAIGVYCTSVFLVLICVLFILFYKRTSTENKLKLENTILNNQISSNEQILKMQESLFELRHDMKHFINVFKSNSDSHDSVTIKEVIDKYEKMSSKEYPVYNTLVPAINYVLNIKAAEAIDKGIDFKCVLNITNNPKIENEDLYLLLSNLLDNAIVHIGLIKRIQVDISEVNELFKIEVINSAIGEVVDENGDFIYSNRKPDHGFGLKTIDILVNKYDGYWQARQYGEDVIVTVYLTANYPTESNSNNL